MFAAVILCMHTHTAVKARCQSPRTRPADEQSLLQSCIDDKPCSIKRRQASAARHALHSVSHCRQLLLTISIDASTHSPPAYVSHHEVPSAFFTRIWSLLQAMLLVVVVVGGGLVGGWVGLGLLGRGLAST